MGVRIILLGGVLAAGLPGLALAQMPSASRNGFQPQFQSKEQNTSREKPPPALPGAQTSPDTDTTKGEPLDLPPTEALFDAINRGDMTEARDALARGADLQGQNVLGMTPIALSIDLGRNDITFLLLSYRGGGGPSTPHPETEATASAEPSNVARHAGQKAAAQVSTPRRPDAIRPRPQATAKANPSKLNANAPNPTATAAGTPGVPVPQAGFLGFGNPAQN